MTTIQAGERVITQSNEEEPLQTDAKEAEPADQKKTIINKHHIQIEENTAEVEEEED